MKTIYVAKDGKPFDFQWECEKYEKQLEKQEEEKRKQEIKRLSDAFLLSVGFDVSKYHTELEKNQALGMT